jgi:protein-disulfide isomerase
MAILSPVYEDDHCLGDKEAPIIFIEYGDFENRYCKESESVVKEIIKEFGKNMLFVYRHFPDIKNHEHAEAAAEASEAAAAQGKFWPMHDKMLAEKNPLDFYNLVHLATELGLDVERFRDELSKEIYYRRVERDIFSGDVLGVKAAPMFIVNGKRHEDDYRYETLKPVLDRILEEKL